VIWNVLIQDKLFGLSINMSDDFSDWLSAVELVVS